MRLFPFKLFKVKGKSMEPTLKEGDYVLLRLTRRVKNGDLVVFNHGNKEMIKRVSKVEGSKLWVIGDNKSHSTDSRYFGWVDTKEVTGRVIWKIK